MVRENATKPRRSFTPKPVPVSAPACQGLSLDDGSKEKIALDGETVFRAESKPKRKRMKQNEVAKVDENVRLKRRVQTLANGIRLKGPEEKFALDGEADLRGQRKQKGKARKQDEVAKVDENIRIKRRVKSLVNRIRLEQNLIDAYAGEGWKGNSREKIRPEKELQRAAVQILECQVAIRDLIHDLDNLGLEGSLAFDEEGKIFHEEIFCAKCKSQEAFPDNDIILCDGSCDRGFHQECLQPPLATADIPPGDEGWLCPVCDSKVECLSYINGYFGTDFQVEDSWDKIFAAAAAAAAAGGCDATHALGQDWPSEDSDDDDYDPERKVMDDGNRGDQGAGDEDEEAGSVDSSSGSEEGDSSSDDDSESAGLDGHELGHDGSLQGEDNESGDALHSGNSEDDLEITGSILAAEDVIPVAGKRQRRPVDYKKLHDEMFGKEEPDDDMQSEDEEWGPSRRGKRGKPEGPNGVAGTQSNGLQLGKAHNSVRRKFLTEQPSNDGNKPNHIGREPFDVQQSDGRARRLPDSAVALLRHEFETGTCLPTRAYKEALAQKLGISFKQVSSWFKSARNAARRRGQSSSTPLQKKKNDECPILDQHLRDTEEGEDEMGITNGLLVDKLDDLQLKLRHLKQALEAIVAEPDEGSELDWLGRPADGSFDSGVVISHADGKRILYVPVAEVVEKDAERNIAGYEKVKKRRHLTS